MTTRFPFLLSLLGCAMIALANDESATGYDITDADRALMMESANAYSSCLHEKSDALMSKIDDVRVIADTAMQECEGVMTELDTALAAQGLAEDFRMGFIRHTKNSSVRRLLPELMARRSAESAAGEAAEP
ncbi:MAG: hypothetical protein HONDAALG_00309 [Gammaproteobacteria bacterium]|nr:hypothetical protein [Gammaproteobacteria bacterium]